MTTATNPAYPTELPNPNGIEVIKSPGLTIREIFAMKSNAEREIHSPESWTMQIASDITGIPEPETAEASPDEVRKQQFQFWFDVEAAIKVMKADALINALNRN